MGVFDFLLGSSRRVTAPSLPSTTDHAVTEAVMRADAGRLDALGVGADILLANGETVATFALKTQSGHYERYGAICRQFQEDDGGFHDRVEMIASLSVGLQPNGFYALACTKLSSLGLLQRLNIPSDKWPAALIDDNFFAHWNAHYPKLNAAYARCEKGNALLQKIESTASLRNEWGESPVELRHNCDAVAKHENIYINRTNAVLKKAAEFSKDLEKPIDAEHFIEYARDEKLRKIFPWLTTYKPSEKDFLDTFDPSWAEREKTEIAVRQARQKLKSTAIIGPSGTLTDAPQQDVMRQMQILYLHEIGFYHWLPNKRTIEVEKTIALDKLQKRDAVKIDALSAAASAKLSGAEMSRA